MKLEQSFEVAAPLDRVWAALIDVERVAPCLPGAEVSGRNDDGSYNGSFRVKLGPTAAAYTGKLEMESVDECVPYRDDAGRRHRPARPGRRQGHDRLDRQGGRGGHDRGRGRRPTTRITGRLARFGRGGMIEEIGNRLLTEFAASLQAMLAGPGDYETFVGMPAVAGAKAGGGG